jgi:integrase
MIMGGVSPKTAKKYSRSGELHQNFCTQENIRFWTEFTKSKFEEYGRNLADKYSDRSLYFELTQLKTILKWLVEEKLLPADSLFRFPISKPQGSDTHCYTLEQVTAMLEVCSQDEGLHWLQFMIVVLACTGLRISELVGLRWTDIQADGNWINLTDERASKRRTELGTARTTKGRRGRTIPLHPDLKQLLKQIPKRQHGRILSGPLGGIIEPDRARRRFIANVIKPLATRFPTPAGEIGFEQARFHSFRHYFVSQAFRQGATEAEIMDWVGHRDSKTVALYRHLGSEDAQRRMQQLNFVGLNSNPDGPGATV